MQEIDDNFEQEAKRYLLLWRERARHLAELREIESAKRKKQVQIDKQRKKVRDRLKKEIIKQRERKKYNIEKAREKKKYKLENKNPKTAKYYAKRRGHPLRDLGLAKKVYDMRKSGMTYMELALYYRKHFEWIRRYINEWQSHLEYLKEREQENNESTIESDTNRN